MHTGPDPRGRALWHTAEHCGTPIRVIAAAAHTAARRSMGPPPPGGIGELELLNLKGCKLRVGTWGPAADSDSEALAMESALAA